MMVYNQHRLFIKCIEKINFIIQTFPMLTGFVSLNVTRKTDGCVND
jgi:hypothetical protein